MTGTSHMLVGHSFSCRSKHLTAEEYARDKLIPQNWFYVVFSILVFFFKNVSVQQSLIFVINNNYIIVWKNGFFFDRNSIKAII